MMIVKVIGKIVAVPAIIMITALLGVASAFEKISNFFIGIFNLVIILGAIAAVCVTGSWDMAKTMFMFLVVENVIIAIIGFGMGMIAILRDKLMEFMAA